MLGLIKKGIIMNGKEVKYKMENIGKNPLNMAHWKLMNTDQYQWRAESKGS